MSPHPKLRRFFKWSSAAASALLLSLWIASGRYWFTWESQRGRVIGLGAGRVLFIEPAFDRRAGFSTNSPRAGFRLVGPVTWHIAPGLYLSRDGMGTGIGLPLWPLTAASIVVCTLIWRRDLEIRRRTRTGACLECGYDCTSLPPDAVCPECGTPSGPRRRVIL